MEKIQNILNTITADIKTNTNRGTVASYIPELAHVDSTKFGIHLLDIHQNNYSTGDSEEAFSIQSISKVFSLAQAFSIVEDKLWERLDILLIIYHF